MFGLQKLGSYIDFANKLNQLSVVFRSFTSTLFEDFLSPDCFFNQSVLDAIPIISYSGKLNAKVAKEITDKEYCSTKILYYNNLKLHALAFRRLDKNPFPKEILISTASVNALTVFKDPWSKKTNRNFFGDKLYNNQEFFTDLE